MSEPALIPLLPISSARTLELCQSPPEFSHGHTIFICSYPKSGTTWTQNIVYQLLSSGNQNFSHISQFSPFYEIDKTWDLRQGIVDSQYTMNHEKLGKRAFNTHLRLSMLPKGPNYKYIYLYRNGKDVVASFYHHLANQDGDGGYSGSFKDFLTDWCNGTLPYGHWIDHVQEWLCAGHEGFFFYLTTPYRAVLFTIQCIHDAESSPGSVLLLRYDDMVADLPSCIRKIAVHLELSIEDQEIENIVPLVTFSHMKANRDQFQPISVAWKPGFEFIRKGVVGDGQSLFGSEEEILFEEMVKSRYPDGSLPHWLQGLI